MNGGAMTQQDRDRLTRVEVQLEGLQREARETKENLKSLNNDFQALAKEIRQSLSSVAANLSQPLDQLTGGKKALVALGAIITGIVTVVGTVMGIIAYFRPPH